MTETFKIEIPEEDKIDIIFDMDGTLSNPEHRRHFVTVKPYNWKKFKELASDDKPIEPIAVLARSLGTLAHRILIVTARDELQRKQTDFWLAMYQIPCHRMYMRENGDTREDAVVKEEILDRIIRDGYNPKLVFDDRSSCVAVWRRRGLICAQVAEGSF